MNVRPFSLWFHPHQEENLLLADDPGMYLPYIQFSIFGLIGNIFLLSARRLSRRSSTTRKKRLKDCIAMFVADLWLADNGGPLKVDIVRMSLLHLCFSFFCCKMECQDQTNRFKQCSLNCQILNMLKELKGGLFCLL